MRVTTRARVHTFDASGEVRARPDKLAGEEPLEVRLDGEQFTVTMRTPGHDVELISGFLLSEAVITRHDQIEEIDFATGLEPDGSRNYNVARVRLSPGVYDPHKYSARQVYTSSSCGICGTASIEAVQKESAFPLVDAGIDLGAPTRQQEPGDLGFDARDYSGSPLIGPAELLALPDRLRAEQALFDVTGGVHAAALFRVPTPDVNGAAPRREKGSREPELLAVREDVGRHNAVDKVIGWALAQGLVPLHDTVLQVSGRASFELVQKAAMAGIPLLSAVSAPSSLAVDLGKSSGVTVVGFNRGRTLNVYSHPWRVEGSSA